MRLLLLLVAVVAVLGTVRGSDVKSDKKPNTAEDVAKQHFVWFEQAVDGIVKSVGVKTVRDLPKRFLPIFEKCYDTAKDMRERAKCVVQAMRNRGSDKPSAYAKFWELLALSRDRRNKKMQEARKYTTTTTTTTTTTEQPTTTTTTTQRPVTRDETSRRTLSRWHRLATRPDRVRTVTRLSQSRSPVRPSTTPRPRPRYLAASVRRWNRLAGRGAHVRSKRQVRLRDMGIDENMVNDYPTLGQHYQPLPKNFPGLTPEERDSFIILPEAPLGGISTIPDVIKQVQNMINGQPLHDSIKKIQRSKAEFKPTWHRFQRLMKLAKYNQGDLDKMFDAVGYVDTKHEKDDKIKFLIKTVQDFGRVAKAHNVSGLSLFSPRFLSLSPKHEASATFFSPELLSLYDNEQPLSFAGVLEAMEISDHDAWMDLILETTGAANTVNEVLDWVDTDTTASEIEKFCKTHLRFIEHWDRLYQTYTKEQNEQLNTDGYTFLESYQYDLLYSGPYQNTTGIKDKIDFYKSLNKQDRVQLLEDQVRYVAGEEDALRGWDRRLRDTTTITSSSSSSEVPGTLLSPAVLSADGILAPGVFGHVTLSPSVFVPVILSPGLLNPIVLSPYVGNPFILSPYVLGPTVLSPYGLGPYILTPHVLSGNVISPFFLSPSILSPYVLSPTVISPSVLSGGILSPGVLSPSPLSPGVLNADVLSPTILS